MGSERQVGPFTGLVEGNKLLTMLVSIPRMASSVRLILITGMVSDERLVSYFAMQISVERLDSLSGEFFGREARPFTRIDAEEWLVPIQGLILKRGWSLYRF